MKKNLYVLLGAVALIVIIWFVIHSLVQRGGSPQGRSLSAIYKNAQDLESKGAYLNAQALYRDILDKTHDEALIQNVKNDLMNLNMKILFSPLATEDSFIYVVEKGDTLGKIAKKFNTTVGLIMRSNGLKNDVIRPNQRLKISRAKYSVEVDYSDNILSLKSDGALLKRYVVATGINGSTPLGEFKIINKLKDPVWYKTGAIVPSGSAENILGTRWMGLSIAGYGIHGTTDPESIGSHVTAGCVRMKLKDVEELYDILPIGTTVIIKD